MLDLARLEEESKARAREDFEKMIKETPGQRMTEEEAEAGAEARNKAAVAIVTLFGIEQCKFATDHRVKEGDLYKAYLAHFKKSKFGSWKNLIVPLRHSKFTDTFLDVFGDKVVRRKYEGSNTFKGISIK